MLNKEITLKMMNYKITPRITQKMLNEKITLHPETNLNTPKRRSKITFKNTSSKSTPKVTSQLAKKS